MDKTRKPEKPLAGWARRFLSSTLLYGATGLLAVSLIWGDGARSFAQGNTNPPENVAQPEIPPEDEIIPPPNAPVSAKVLRYSTRIIRAYDRNGDLVLQSEEMGSMRGSPKEADLNQNGLLEVSEFAQYIANFGRRRKIRLLFSQDQIVEEGNPAILNPLTPAASEGADLAVPGDSSSEESASAVEGDTGVSDAAAQRFHVRKPRANLPNWFTAKDANGDGQVSMAEYAPNATKAELTDFARMDSDADGVLTPRELLGPKAAPPKRVPARPPAANEQAPAGDSPPPAAEAASSSEPAASDGADTSASSPPDASAENADKSDTEQPDRSSDDGSGRRRRRPSSREERTRQKDR